MKPLFIPVLLFLAGLGPLLAQQVTGTVSNELGEPVPFANIFVQELQTGALADDAGYYELDLDVEGDYHLIVSSLGYETRKVLVAFTPEPQVVNVRVRTSGVALQEIVVNADDRDPAYGIIKKVSERRNEHLRAADTYRALVYVKATEEIEDGPRPRRPRPISIDDAPEDPFATTPSADEELLARLNMVEMNVRLNHAAPSRYKEEREAYRAYGDASGLFLPVLAETDFNFYRNLVRLPGIADAPVISPFSPTAVLSYRFRLESTDLEGADQLVYRITVEPRKVGNSTVSGTVWINEGSWTINRLDLQLPEGALRSTDAFAIRQEYQPVADNLWVHRLQEFRYATELGRRKTFRGTTTLSYSDYEIGYEFPEKFFGNEVAVTTREAYQRDTSYWRAGRTVALNEEEAEVVRLRDSIEIIHNSKPYKDSIQRVYNKVSLLEIGLDGLGFRNHEAKTHLYVGSLLDLIDFSPVGGFRLGPYLSHFKRFDSGRVFSNSGTLNVGLRNGDVQGNFDSYVIYDPFRRGSLALSGGRNFQSINQFDAYLNQLRPSNYILRDALRVRHAIELTNGLMIRSGLEWNNRRSLRDFDTESAIDGIVSDDEAPIDFETYQAVFLTNSISYTPGQRYLREPDRKVILGSRWPTFTVLHRRGLDGALGSDVDFDYLEGRVDHRLAIGALGQSNYSAKVGAFTNKDDLRFIDWQRFREGDPFLLSDPMETFQSIDTSLNTTDLFAEFHYLHHFNGALINNVPLLKKTKLKTVIGGGLLYLPEENYRHQEVLAGVERTFRIGARRRLRVGAYAVFADANDRAPDTRFKVSFDLIDLWKRNWDF